MSSYLRFHIGITKTPILKKREKSIRKSAGIISLHALSHLKVIAEEENTKPIVRIQAGNALSEIQVQVPAKQRIDIPKRLIGLVEYQILYLRARFDIEVPVRLSSRPCLLTARAVDFIEFAQTLRGYLSRNNST